MGQYGTGGRKGPRSCPPVSSGWLRCKLLLFNGFHLWTSGAGYGMLLPSFFSTVGGKGWGAPLRRSVPHSAPPVFSPLSSRLSTFPPTGTGREGFDRTE